MIKIFDTHAHLDAPRLHEDLVDVLENARIHDVHRIVSIGASHGLESNFRALELARAYPHIRCTAGVHPHDAGKADPEWMRVITEELSGEEEVVAIGEAGLDYFYDKAPVMEQQTLFRAQLQLAKTVQKPIVIHSREAEEDTLKILDEEEYTGGILHCFTGSRPFCEELLARDFYISFSGIVTFKNGKELLEIACDVPLDRLLVETDAPFLAPVPKRGKRNEPAFVRHTAEHIARARGVGLKELARATWDNGSRVFGWDVPYDDA